MVERNDVRNSDIVGLALLEVTNSDILFNRAKDNALDFFDSAPEGENNWFKNKSI